VAKKKRKKKDYKKSPMTRVLDITAGWMEFVQKGSKKVKDPKVAWEELYDLYQGAGLALDHYEKGNYRQERQVAERFVMERILPIILR